MRVFNIPEENWKERARLKANELENSKALLYVDEILPQNDFSCSLGMILYINRVVFFRITSPRFQDNLMCDLIASASHFQST